MSKDYITAEILNVDYRFNIEWKPYKFVCGKLFQTLINKYFIP